MSIELKSRTIETRETNGMIHPRMTEQFSRTSRNPLKTATPINRF